MLPGTPPEVPFCSRKFRAGRRLSLTTLYCIAASPPMFAMVTIALQTASMLSNAVDDPDELPDSLF
jgi:hypothetical protein